MNPEIAQIVQNQPFVSMQVGESRVDLIGTAHISPRSRDVVDALVEQGGYSAVALELCDKRYDTLRGVDPFVDMDLLQLIRNKKLLAVMGTLILASYQKRLGEQLGVEPGAEFKQAIQRAGASDIPITVIDRDVGITLNRFYRRLKWWQRPMLVMSLLHIFFADDKVDEEDLEGMKMQGDMFNAMHSFFPGAQTLITTLIDERDQYMAANVREYIRSATPDSLLVVIGAGHLPGMAQSLETGAEAPADQQLLSEYREVPKGVAWTKFIPWIIVAVILAGFALGFKHNPDLGFSLVIDWILINGSLAALGAIIAGAHPLTSVAAFLAAPLTSINPMVGVGMVTATAQFFLRKPHVSDFKTIKDDIGTLAGWRRNRFSHLLLVFLLSTIGSAIGTYVGVFHIYSGVTS